MTPENLISLDVSHTQHDRLSYGIVSKAEPRQKEYFIRDTEIKGFYLRVLPSGVKSYGISGRFNRTNKKVERIIGSAHTYTPRDAREIARDWLKKIHEGVDPKEHDRNLITPTDLLEKYILSKNLVEKTIDGYRYNFRHYLKPLHKKSIKDITTEDIVSWYGSGVSHATGTERTFVTLKSVLNYGFALGYLEVNPANKAAQLIKRKVNPSKQQHLSNIYDQLPKFMEAFITADISAVMRDWIVLSLTTGLRSQESRTIKWTQVDLDKKRVTLPTNKSDRFLIVPMIGLTYDMFQSRFNLSDRDKEYVFTSKGKNPITGARKALAKIASSADTQQYSHHDFRRLFASVCHELDISEIEIGKLLNHSPKTVTPIYINQSLEKARRKYQQVVNALDRMIAFDDISAEKNEYFLSATDLMRHCFYGKVAPDPDSPVMQEELEANKIRENEYWEGE